MNIRVKVSKKRSCLALNLFNSLLEDGVFNRGIDTIILILNYLSQKKIFIGTKIYGFTAHSTADQDYLK